MKKILLSLISAIFACTTVAASCVTATQLSTDYATQTVIFKLAWTNCNAVNQRFNKAWCFVDFRTANANGSKGAWTRAIVSGTPYVNNGTYTAGNAAGFYVTGTNGQSATVTVKLSNTSAMFDWCAFATDYPPNVSTLAGTTNTFNGTQSFVVNGSTITGNQFTGIVNSLTDATGCPGCIGRDVATNANIPCCSELTAIGGHCRNLTADEATIIPGVDAEVKLQQRGDCAAIGWRYPAQNEAFIMHSNGVYALGYSSGPPGTTARCTKYAAQCAYCTFTPPQVWVNGYRCYPYGGWGVLNDTKNAYCIR